MSDRELTEEQLEAIKSLMPETGNPKDMEVILKFLIREDLSIRTTITGWNGSPLHTSEQYIRLAEKLALYAYIYAVQSKNEELIEQLKPAIPKRFLTE